MTKEEYKEGKYSFEKEISSGEIRKEFNESNLKISSPYAKPELKTKDDYIERHKQLELARKRVEEQYILEESTGTTFAKEMRDKHIAEIERLQQENIEKYKSKFYTRKDGSKKEFHYAGEELYSDDPNRFGDAVKKHNEKMFKEQQESAKRVEEIYLKDRYKGTYEYLQNTTNMSGTEILELLKKIDEDKK